MGAGKINLLNKGVIMTRNLSVWNSLRPFSVGFDSIFDEFDRMLESTERYNTNYPPYNIHRVDEHNYKIDLVLLLLVTFSFLLLLLLETFIEVSILFTFICLYILIVASASQV